MTKRKKEDNLVSHAECFLEQIHAEIPLMALSYHFAYSFI
jgi:hypothetical protein